MNGVSSTSQKVFWEIYWTAPPRPTLLFNKSSMRSVLMWKKQCDNLAEVNWHGQPLLYYVENWELPPTPNKKFYWTTRLGLFFRSRFSFDWGRKPSASHVFLSGLNVSKSWHDSAGLCKANELILSQDISEPGRTIWAECSRLCKRTSKWWHACGGVGSGQAAKESSCPQRVRIWMDTNTTTTTIIPASIKNELAVFGKVRFRIRFYPIVQMGVYLYTVSFSKLIWSGVGCPKLFVHWCKMTRKSGMLFILVCDFVSRGTRALHFFFLILWI